MPIHKGSGNNQEAITACGVPLIEVYKGSALVWQGFNLVPPHPELFEVYEADALICTLKGREYRTIDENKVIVAYGRRPSGWDNPVVVSTFDGSGQYTPTQHGGQAGYLKYHGKKFYYSNGELAWNGDYTSTEGFALRHPDMTETVDDEVKAQALLLLDLYFFGLKATLDTQGGYCSPEYSVILNGYKYVKLPDVVTRDGYLWTGVWALEDGTEVTTDTVCTATTDHTIYAQWQSVNPRTEMEVSAKYTLICTFGDRKYYTADDNKVIVGYGKRGEWNNPVVVSETDGSAQYTDGSYNKRGQGGSLNYHGRIFYYSSGQWAVTGTPVSTGGVGLQIPTLESNSIEEQAIALLDMYYGITGE